MPERTGASSRAAQSPGNGGDAGMRPTGMFATMDGAEQANGFARTLL
jgi:hypothetical protein